MSLFSTYKGLRREIYVLFFSKIITAMGSTVWSMMVIILSSKLNFSATKISLWMSIYSLILMPISMLGGKLSDHYDKKKILVYSDVVEAILYTICFLLPLSELSIAIFMFASIIENLSYSAYEVLVADLSSSDEREKANSLMYLGGNIGMVLTPLLAGFLVNRNVNLMFLISATTTSIALIIEVLYLKDLSINTQNNNIYEKPQKGEKLLKLFKLNKPVVYFIIINSFIWAIYSEYNFLTPLDLTKVFGEKGSTVYGILSSINCFTVITCTTILAKICEKLSDLLQTAIATLFFGFGYMLFATLMKYELVCYMAFFIFTIGEILATTSTSPIITRRIPSSHRGRFLAFSNVMGNLVYIIFQSIISNIYETQGSLLVWMIIIVSCGLIAISLTVLIKYDKKRYPELY